VGVATAFGAWVSGEWLTAGSPPKPRQDVEAFAGLAGSRGEPEALGKQLERLIGHLVSLSLVTRPALSIFRAAYSFIRDTYAIPVAPWDSIKQELFIAAAILPVPSAPLSRGWSGKVDATDASSTGWGICSMTLPPAVAAREGRCEERWRFRRLPPSEWCPQRRALDSHHRLDPFSDLSTVEVEGSFGTPHMPPRASEPVWEAREGFPELGFWVSSATWSTDRAGRFRFEKSIGQKEG